MKITTDQVTSCLERVMDPELGISVVDLGLIYNILIDGNKVSVDMTLTNPGCPMAGMLAGGVWEPAWTPERLTESGKAQLGYAP